MATSFTSYVYVLISYLKSLIELHYVQNIAIILHNFWEDLVLSYDFHAEKYDLHMMEKSSKNDRLILSLVFVVKNG